MPPSSHPSVPATTDGNFPKGIAAAPTPEATLGHQTATPCRRHAVSAGAAHRAKCRANAVPARQIAPQQGESELLRLFPVALIATHQRSNNHHQQNDHGDPPISGQPAIILLRLSAHPALDSTDHLPLTALIMSHHSSVKMPSYLPRTARIMSHMGVKIPSARISTITATIPIRIGSIRAVRLLRS